MHNQATMQQNWNMTKDEKRKNYYNLFPLWPWPVQGHDKNRDCWLVLFKLDAI